MKRVIEVVTSFKCCIFGLRASGIATVELQCTAGRRRDDILYLCFHVNTFISMVQLVLYVTTPTSTSPKSHSTFYNSPQSDHPTVQTSQAPQYLLQEDISTP